MPMALAHENEQQHRNMTDYVAHGKKPVQVRNTVPEASLRASLMGRHGGFSSSPWYIGIWITR